MARETAIPKNDAVVVVVGGPSELVEATRQAASIVAAARVETAELSSAATQCATHRPFAIVMTEDVFSFDSGEFEALARDVGAVLIRIEVGEGGRARLERVLMPRLGAAARARR